MRCLKELDTAAAPLYGDNGELLDGGGDLDLGGVTSYYHDLIYLSAGVQLLSGLTDKAWLAFLLVCHSCTLYALSSWC